MATNSSSLPSQAAAESSSIASSSSLSKQKTSHPGASAIQHSRKDFYSQNKPIPSIQRFFKRGLVDVIATLKEGDSEEEEEEEEKKKRESEAVQKDNDTTASKGNGLTSEFDKQSHPDHPDATVTRRTHKPRLVDDPITGRKVYIHDVGKREYENAMDQADEIQKIEKEMLNEKKTTLPKLDIQSIGISSNENVISPTSVAENDLVSPTSGKRRSLFGNGSLRRRKSGTPGHAKKPSRSGSIFRRNGDNGSENDSSDEDDSPSNNPSRPRNNGIAYNENVLSMPFPPIDSLPPNVLLIHPTLLPSFAVWSILLIFRLVHPIISVLGAAWLVWFAHKKIHDGAEDKRWERERQRGIQARRGVDKPKEQARFDELTQTEEGIKEGAEWLNEIMEGLWAVMNPELFSGMGATLEDVMQASIPKFIHAVKVEDLAQGNTPLRLTGFRVLPDSQANELRAASQQYMRQEREKEEQRRSKAMGQEQDDQKTKNTVEDAGAKFINLELSFVYRARPTTDSVASKSRNAHLLIKFWVGAKKLVTVPLPVWVEIKGIVGSIRARVQLTPDPPFIKNVTFSFMGLPRVGVEVIPLHINTSSIPLISGFIQSSIDAALGEYCAPSSMTMDVGEMLMGDNIKREVDALGVVVIYIHSAHDLEKQDVQGSSDPYCTIQLAKYGKVQYATRVALDDLSPRWEERYVMLIHPEAVRAREKIAVGLWDSDRFSADDILGRVEVDLLELVKRPGRLFRRTDTLVGLTQDSKKQGLLKWSVGFFAKTPNKRRLTDETAREKDAQEAEKVYNQDPDLIGVQEVDLGKDYHTKEPIEDQEYSDIQQELHDLHLDKFDSRITAKQTRNIEHAVSFEPPSAALPSGILSMQVHQISNLEVTDSRDQRNAGSKVRGMGHPGQDVETIDTDEDKTNAPSAYFTIILNDETVFKSRTKALSTNPFYNAGTERFVRDWRRTLVMFVVYDNRLREDDAILGVVPIKLTDLFHSTSQVTTNFPLAGGVGRGHIRLSLLFRPIQNLSRHKEKLGWDIGTMRILSSLHAHELVGGSADANALTSASVRARTLAGHFRISSRRAKYTDQRVQKEVEWQIRKDEFPIKVPVRRRYASPYVIEFRTHGALGLHKTIAMCILWMQDVADDDIGEYKLPIWRATQGGDFHRLLQNYHDFRKEEEAHRLGVERMGYLNVKLQFKSGMGKVHAKFESKNPDARSVMDAWRACTSVGLRRVSGDFTEMRWNTEGLLVDESKVDSMDLGKEQAGKPIKRHSRQKSDISKKSFGSKYSANASNDSNDDESDEDVRDRRVSAMEGVQGEGDSMSDSDDDSINETGTIGEESVLEKLRKWNDERKELHRQHKGLKQFKPVRTATWIGREIRDRSSRAANSLTLQERRAAGQIESEL